MLHFWILPDSLFVNCTLKASPWRTTRKIFVSIRIIIEKVFVFPVVPPAYRRGRCVNKYEIAFALVCIGKVRHKKKVHETMPYTYVSFSVSSVSFSVGFPVGINRSAASERHFHRHQQVAAHAPSRTPLK